MITEAEDKYATQMEQSIIDIADGKTKEEMQYSGQFEVATSIVEYLRDNGIKATSGDKVSGTKITKWWKDNGGKNATPKTDIQIDGTELISLKQSGGSQLMSGKSGETKATFRAAVETLTEEQGKFSERVISKVEKEIERMFAEKTKNNKTEIEKQQKGKIELKAGDILDYDIKDVESIQAGFANFLNNQFTNNPDFKRAMTFEAMSGDRKFDNEGRAEKILIFKKSTNPTDHEIHELKDWNSPIVKTKSDHAKVSVSFKSASGGKGTAAGKYSNLYSALRLLNDSVKTEMTGKLLTEGKWLNIVKSAWKSIWKKIKAWLTKSFSNVISFLGLEPEMTASVTW